MTADNQIGMLKGIKSKMKILKFFVLEVQLILIVLRICKVITWNWFVILAPLWIPCLFFVILLAIVGFIAIHDDEWLDK